MKKVLFVLATSALALFFSSPAIYSEESFDGIDETVESLVDQIREQGAVEGLRLQCSPENFYIRGDLSRPPISRLLYELVVTELSEHHVDISLHERGTYPLKLFGFLEIFDDVLSISLIIRRMEEAGSHNLAMARAAIFRSAIPPALLAISISDLAGQLVRKIEKQFSSSAGQPVHVSVPIPAEPGGVTLAFGNLLQEELRIAVLDSEVFGEDEVAGDGREKLLLSSNYEVGEEVVVRASLKNTHNRVVARAASRVPRSEYPESFWEPAPISVQEVCIDIELDGVHETALYAERSLVSEVTGAIDKAGGVIVPCSSGSPSNRVNVFMRVREKQMHEGYGVLFGTLSVTVEKNREEWASIDTKGTYPFTDDRKGGMKGLVRDLVDEDVKKYIHTKLLSTSGTTR